MSVMVVILCSICEVCGRVWLLQRGEGRERERGERENVSFDWLRRRKI